MAIALEIARRIEMAEGAAYADLLRAAPHEWGCVADPTTQGWLLLAPPVDVLLFNRIVGCGVAAVADRETLLALVERYRAAGVRNYGVQLSPSAQPSDVADWLRGAGLEQRDRWAKVYRGGEAAIAVPTALRVSAAGAADAARFAEVTTTGFGMPAALRPWIAATVGRERWHHYLAWDGDVPVAGAALFVDGGGGWLGIASTVPGARRRGAQGALMARRIEEGRALGCRWFVTETAEDLPARPNPSFRNMIRAGFSLAYCRDNFLAAADRPDHA